MWERDTTNLVDKRYVYYAGLGYRILTSPTLQASLYTAYGYQDETYEPIVEQLIKIKDLQTPIIYFYETLQWQFIKNMSIQQGFRLIYDTKKRDEFTLCSSGEYVNTADKNHYRYKAFIALDMAVNKFISVVPSYEITYDSVPWPGVLKRDSIGKIALKINF